MIYMRVYIQQPASRDLYISKNSRHEWEFDLRSISNSKPSKRFAITGLGLITRDSRANTKTC